MLLHFFFLHLEVSMPLNSNIIFVDGRRRVRPSVMSMTSWVGGWEERCLISSSLVWNLGIEKVAEYI